MNITRRGFMTGFAAALVAAVGVKKAATALEPAVDDLIYTIEPTDTPFLHLTQANDDWYTDDMRERLTAQVDIYESEFGTHSVVHPRYLEMQEARTALSEAHLKQVVEECFDKTDPSLMYMGENAKAVLSTFTRSKTS